MQRRSPLKAGRPTLRNARTLTLNETRHAGADNSEMNESDNKTVMPLTLSEKMTQVMSFSHSSIQMRKMQMRGKMPHVQGEP